MRGQRIEEAMQGQVGDASGIFAILLSQKKVFGNGL
jgi:hypothetical protein